MSKIQMRWLTIGGIFLALFNILFFLLGGDLSRASVWISYAAIHLSYILMLVIPFLVPKAKSTHVYLESTALIASICFIIDFVIGLLLIIIKPESHVLTLAIHLVILSASAVVLCVNHYATHHTASIEEQKKQAQKAFKESLLILSQAMTKVDDPEKQYIASIYNDLKASPLYSSGSLQGVENNIRAECNAIHDAASEGSADAIRMHGAVLSQLILLRKQNPGD